MKLHFLATIITILLLGFVCLGTPAAGAPQQNPHAVPEPPRRTGGPILERLGEEYFIRLGNGDARAMPPSSSMYPLGVAGGLLKLNRALQRLRLTRRFRHDDDGDDSASAERGRRSEEPPISLDLTFHLLREMMEMSKAEQLAQQAQNNRRMMELFGK
ncbi:corticotropin releasing hormone b [Stigmatopora nigra]